MHEQDFGCSACWPRDANAAWDARAKFAHLHQLADDSHFRVMILGCPLCQQRYVSVFTEMIDWNDRDDPQHWTLLPITASEADDLLSKRSTLAHAHLNTLGPGRRCLRRDHPSGEAARTWWGQGISVGPHD